jgi:hypothetical protein
MFTASPSSGKSAGSTTRPRPQRRGRLKRGNVRGTAAAPIPDAPNTTSTAQFLEQWIKEISQDIYVKDIYAILSYHIKCACRVV